jgi:hypothetical protein
MNPIEPDARDDEARASIARMSEKATSIPRAWRDAVQLMTAAMVTILFVGWGVLGARNIQLQNRDIVEQVRSDLVAHAHGTQHRQCAIATELLYLANHPAKVNGQSFKLVRTAKDQAVLTSLRNEACSFVPLPGPGGTGR